MQVNLVPRFRWFPDQRLVIEPGWLVSFAVRWGWVEWRVPVEGA